MEPDWGHGDGQSHLSDESWGGHPQLDDPEQNGLGNLESRGGMLPLRGNLCPHVDWDNDLFHRLAYFDQLRGSRFGMRLQFAPFHPIISLVVVPDITEQEARIAPVNDQPDVPAHPHRPEALVLRLVELVETHS